MIIFDRKAGTLTHEGSPQPFARGIWSGHGQAHNNPAMEKVQKIGPLPAGIYGIGVLEAQHGHLGRDVMALTPLPGTNTFGRSAFYMHGDSDGDVDFSASEGCIIAPHNIRILVNAMTDRRIKVI